MADFEVTGTVTLNVDDMLTSVDEILDKLDEFSDKISEIDAQLDDLQNKGVTLDIKINNEDKLDELKIFLDEIDSHIYEIEILINADHAMLDVEELRVDLDELTSVTHEIDINVNTADLADAEIKIEALKEQINELSKAEKNASDSGNKFEFSMLMLAPLLIPASAAVMSLIGGLGGLASAFGTMLPPVALAAYGTEQLYKSISTLYTGLNASTQAALLNASTLSQMQSILEKNSTAFDHMSKSEQGAVLSYVTLKQVLSQFQDSIKPEALSLLTNGLNLATKLLSMMIDPADEAAGAISSLLSDFSNRLDDPTFQTFFNNMDKNIGTLVTDWGGGVENIIEGIVAILNAFTPMSMKMSGGFLTMTQDFDTWAQHLGSSPGFQKFAATVETDGPMILKIVGQVIELIGRLVTSMGESKINTSMFSTLLSFLQRLNGASAAHPAMTQLATDLTLVGLAAIKLGPALGPLMAFIATPVGAVVVAIVAIGAAFIIAYQKSATFRNWVQQNIFPLFNSLKGYATQFEQWFTSIWPEIQQVWDMYGQNILNIIVKVFDFIVQTIGNALKVIEGIIDIVLGLLTGNWTQVWTGIKDVFGAVWDEITLIVRDAWGIIENIFDIAWGIIKKIFSSAWDGLLNNFQTNWGKIEGWLEAFPGDIVKWLGDLGSLLYNAGAAVLQGFWDGLKSMVSGIENWFDSFTSKLTDWKGPPSRDSQLLTNSGQLIMQSFITGLESKYGAVKNSLSGFTNNLGDSMSKQITADLTAKIQSSFNSSASGVSGAMASTNAGAMATGIGTGTTQVVFANGAIQISNATPENPGTSLTRTMQAISKFGTIQMPSGMSATVS